MLLSLRKMASTPYLRRLGLSRAELSFELRRTLECCVLLQGTLQWQIPWHCRAAGALRCRLIIDAMSFTTVIHNGRRSSFSRKSRGAETISLRYHPAVKLQKSVESEGVALQAMNTIPSGKGAALETNPLQARNNGQKENWERKKGQRKRLFTNNPVLGAIFPPFPGEANINFWPDARNRFCPHQICNVTRVPRPFQCMPVNNNSECAHKMGCCLAEDSLSPHPIIHIPNHF